MWYHIEMALYMIMGYIEGSFHSRVPESPISKTVFLPPHSLSANLPQAMAVTNCAAVKLLCMIPACVAIVDAGKVSSKDFN